MLHGQRSTIPSTAPQLDLDMDMDMDMDKEEEEELKLAVCPVWHSDGFRCLLQHLK